MNKLNGLLTGAMLASVVLGSTALAVADDGKKPVLNTNPATGVLASSAMLAGEIKPKGSTTTYRFEYGPTTGYGKSSATGTLAADQNNTYRPVSSAVSGLSPKTLYHFRIKATNDDGTSSGADRSFTTTATGAAPTGTAGTQVEPPKLGSTVSVAVLEGTIKVRRSGGSGYTTLAAGESIPVGSFVNARHGTVELTSSLGQGKTQSGEFGRGLFKVTQSRTGHGMTDLALRGSSFAGCARTGAHHKSKPPNRRLFGRDTGGRFRTHGRDSVATVRGTSWVTTDTCAGTRTTVKKGAVSVRARHRAKAVLVRAGHSYLARHAHHKPRRITTAPRGLAH